MESPATASSDTVFDPPALSSRAIESWLADAGCQLDCVVETVDETASTNADLMARAREATCLTASSPIISRHVP
jgi:hypothetical protein